jgi:hypothetical protein
VIGSILCFFNFTTCIFKKLFFSLDHPNIDLTHKHNNSATKMSSSQTPDKFNSLLMIIHICGAISLFVEIEISGNDINENICLTTS